MSIRQIFDVTHDIPKNFSICPEKKSSATKNWTSNVLKTRFLRAAKANMQQMILEFKFLRKFQILWRRWFPDQVIKIPYFC